MQLRVARILLPEVQFCSVLNIDGFNYNDRVNGYAGANQIMRHSRPWARRHWINNDNGKAGAKWRLPIIEPLPFFAQMRKSEGEGNTD
ncbi:hypothetical protein SAMN05216386_0732 [Nitrosospira briensis]|uniref:Uncharacterized protein n=1 Tax=Nitrosospira briensis TaxID=35799 RepID=A0A1I4YJH7_9PROT|nr:hypothetical protein SAMN05216386_0732 [Nitrosospira briensis]